MSEASLYVGDTPDCIIRWERPPMDISFHPGGQEVMRFCEDGRIFVRGELVDDNKAVYQAMVDFLSGNLLPTLEVPEKVEQRAETWRDREPLL